MAVELIECGAVDIELSVASPQEAACGAYILHYNEPSNDLDLTTVEWLEGFLLNCEVPVLYISHDEALLERTVSTIKYFI